MQRKLLLRAALTVIATTMGFCAVVLDAHAHAELMHSTPEPNQRLDKSPKELELRFNENVGPVFFKVLDQAGKAVGDAAPIRADGNSIHLPLRSALTKGTYVVTYRVISADTHPSGGSYAFAVGEPVASGTATATSTASAWVIPTAFARVVLYSTVLIALGSALLLVLSGWPDALQAAVRRQGRIAAGLAAAAFVLALAFGGADIADAGATALFEAATWSAAFSSTLAISAAMGIPGALIAFWGFGHLQKWPIWIGAALLLASFLVTGHAATAAPVWLASTSVGVHLVGAGFWVAALLPLMNSTTSVSQTDAGRIMDKFSSHALWFVGAILVSGAVVSWIQLRSIAALINTDYGFRLLIKLALVLVVLGFAAFNKFTLTPALKHDNVGAARRMARSIGIEAVIMLLIVAAAASLTFVTPPRALAAEVSGVASASLLADNGYKSTWTNGKYSVAIEVTPAKAGANMIMLRFTDAAGMHVAMKSAGVDAALPAASIAGISKEAQPMPPDMFHVTLPEMIIPGNWMLTVNGFVDDFDKVTMTGTVPIK